ncbi:membrane glycosyltransferase [Roseibium hamelinense]|uniref:Glucans biosynthesis glucosyltransferase H n=1 Tax=Roseibium hamelinense TaxID=150831 RepID=A0A562SGU0_9HYPH|nr:glucans biosynthesis glucosyltransferase MdoH [Roseibium hamelinense]MTI44239.1 glucans biosynthesis glucosyltransferase MdoH [Roseibium hamelinense]TWI79976.1 membrane glycosyltransferase [Roseibium hamelinense]
MASAVFIRRCGMVVFAGALTFAAAAMFGTVAQADGFVWLDVVRIGLLSVAAFWLAWGGCIAFFGLLFPPQAVARHDQPIAARTAVLMPVYNEDTEAVFARMTAMMRSVAALPEAEQFDFFILSDTTDLTIAEREAGVYRRVVDREGVEGRLFYRRRDKNTGRKAGNIADFVRTYGAAYEFMLILDADSLMTASAIGEMVRRMEAEPKLGLLQTLPQIRGLETLFGRMLQFSTALYAPYFARGLASVQGGEGSFWGHNALVRVRAFAGSCGMAPLTGKPPFGGHILSHDTVEAALLARDGWQVRIDPDLTGSYEEAPANMVEYAKRDRRWCQGNLQHARLILAPRFKLWSRFAIVQGIFAYLASPIWLLFLIASLAAPLFASAPVYFVGLSPFPTFPHPETATALALLFGLVALLILPKLMLVVRALVRGGNRGFGGGARLAFGGFCETLMTSVLAPIHMMFQCRSVLQILTGADAGWPAADRADGSLSLGASFSATWWMSLTGGAAMAFAYHITPELFFWLMPVTVPLILAPVLVFVTASVRLGRAARRVGLFQIPAEHAPEPVVLAMLEIRKPVAS